METRLVPYSYARTFRYWNINSTRSPIRTIRYKLHLSLQPQCWFSNTLSSILPSSFSTTITIIYWKTSPSWYIIFRWERTTKSVTLYTVSVSNIIYQFKPIILWLRDVREQKISGFDCQAFTSLNPDTYACVWINFINPFVHALDSFRLLLFIKTHF